MAAHSGSNKVTDGLVLSIDADNVKNYKNITSNNIVVGGAFPNGNDIPAEGGSNTQNDIIQLPNPGDSAYVLRQTMGSPSTEYQLTYYGVIQPSTTYVLSGWYAESADYVGDSRMFHCRAYSASGAHTSLGNGIGAQIGDSVTVGGLTWTYRYATLTSPADPSGTFMWYLGYGISSSSYTGARYYTNLKIEQGTYPTVPDLTLNQNNLISVNGVTYSNGAYNLDGSNDYMYHPTFSLGTDPIFSVEMVVKRTANLKNAGFWGLGGGDLNRGINGYTNTTNMIGWDLWGRTTIDTGINYPLNEWVHVTWVKVSTGFTTSSLKIYINGEEFPVNKIRRSNSSSVNLLNGLSVGRVSPTVNNYYGSCNVGKFEIYDRALTASEVKQNFMASRKRFGI